jgi:hypothetical protein
MVRPRMGTDKKIKPDWEADGVQLYRGDCRKILPLIERPFAIVSDPPYGIGYKHGVHNGGIAPGTSKTNRMVGDDQPFVPDHLLGLAEVTLLFGSQYYRERLPGGGAGWHGTRARAAVQPTWAPIAISPGALGSGSSETSSGIYGRG